MAYDLLIKNGRIVDGSGMPAFRGDVGIKNGKIAEIGKLSGPAKRTIDAAGQVVAPGFVDNHCHYDAQVTWDPLCSFSPDHGCTTVVFGNCSLALAPVRPGAAKRVAEFLSYVEAIPMEVLNTVEVDWETIPQYMDRLDQHLGVNVGNLIGHSTVRYYVMGDESQKRAATDDEIKKMQDVVRDGIKGGALGLSVSRNKGHYDPQGVHIPALWAEEKEIFALGDVLREMGTGIIQSGGGRAAELQDGLMARLSEATGRTVIYNNLGQTVREPDAWKKAHGAGRGDVEGRDPGLSAVQPEPRHPELSRCATARCSAARRPGTRSYCLPMKKSCAPMPTLAIRQKLHEEVVEHKVQVPAAGYSRQWYDYMWVETPVSGKEPGAEGQDDRPDRQGAEQAGHRRVPGSRRRRESRHGLHAVGKQCRRRSDGEDPDLSERHCRAVGWRGARAVPWRLRLQHAAPQRVGARKAGHDPRTRGAAVDLRLSFGTGAVRPRPDPARHGGRHRDLRSRHGTAAARRPSSMTSRRAAGA